MSSIDVDFLTTCLMADRPVMMVGDPGTSKTATINAVAEKLGYEVLPLLLSQLEAVSITGHPVPSHIVDPDGNEHLITEYAMQWWQYKILTQKKVLLFLDEFSNALPGTRAAMLTLVQDRRFPNGDKMPAETRIIGAMNPTDSAEDGYDIGPATANRWVWRHWSPSVKSWVDNFVDNWGKGVVSGNERSWRSTIASYIEKNPGQLHQMKNTMVGTPAANGVDSHDSSDMTCAAMAWASRRSWDNLAVILGSIDPEMKNKENLEDELMRGTVGPEATLHFRRWLEEHGRLQVDKIIADPDSFSGWAKLNQNDSTTILDSCFKNLDEHNYGNVMKILWKFHHVDEGTLEKLIEFGRVPTTIGNRKIKVSDISGTQVGGTADGREGILGPHYTKIAQIRKLNGHSSALPAAEINKLREETQEFLVTMAGLREASANRTGK